MELEPFCLTPSEINLKACEFSLMNRSGNEHFILLATYGALMDPEGDMFIRTKDEFARVKGHKLESKEDLQKYFLGFYKLPNVKLNFQKKVLDNEHEGKATLSESWNNETYVAIWALPKQCFRPGSTLMNSEGSYKPFDLYNKRNEYVLRTNCIKAIESVNNSTRPSPEWFTGEQSTFYLFLAGEQYIEYKQKLLPSPEYAKKIVSAYKKGKELGYEIPDNYISFVEMQALIA